MDPPGILMLRSVRIVFEMIGIKPESIKVIKEEFSYGTLVKALTEQPKKCPVIVTCDYSSGYQSPHIMVATNALQGKEFIHPNQPVFQALRNEWFINCKNSYRDDVSEPGLF